VLRLNFRTLNGDSPTLMLAGCVRFCADGTVRGPDHFVIAQCIEGAWRVGGRLHRELECEGPVRLRVSGANMSPLHFGPFSQLRTSGPFLYGDGEKLDVLVPGRSPLGAARELTLLPGVPHAQA
jgi:hypothetical protein